MSSDAKTAAFLVVLLSLLSCFNAHADDSCKPMARSIDSPIRFFTSLTLALHSEVLYKSALSDAQGCPSDKPALYRAKFELANFWGKFGFELQQAEQLQKEVAAHYSKQLKWKGKRLEKRYYAAYYSLAEIYYKQGKFNLVLTIINHMQLRLIKNPPVDPQYNPNLKALKMLLAIALEGIVDLGSIEYHWQEDLQRLKTDVANQNESYNGENRRVGTNRDALTRLTRWLNYKNTFSETNGNYRPLAFLDKQLNKIIDAAEVDELYIDYALNRLMQQSDAICDSAFAKFVIKRYQRNSIETNINVVIAESIVARCSQRLNTVKFIDRYVKNLQHFLNTMPADFAPEVFYELKYFMEALLDQVDWVNLGANNSLLKLLQLRQAVNPTLSSARFDSTLIRNKQARIKYVEREQLKNAYYKLSRPNLPAKEKEQLVAITRQLMTIEEEINLRYPQLTKYGASRIYNIRDMQQALGDKQQLLIVAQTKHHIVNMLITNSDVSVTLSAGQHEETTRLINKIRAQTIAGQEVRRYSQTFSQKLPMLAKLKSNKTQLLIHSDNYFSALPMSLLYDTANGSWLIENYRLERHLNLASIVAPSPLNRTFRTRLAIANPNYAKLKQRGKGPKVVLGNLRQLQTSNNSQTQHTSGKQNKIEKDKQGDMIASMPPLRGTILEAENLVSTTADVSKILDRNIATESNVIAHLSQPWDIVMFSTHTLFPGNKIPLNYPSLLLTPNDQKSSDNGLLSSQEIAHLSFINSWIILAACDTSMSVGKRNHLGSLMNSFLLAGSRSVLASHWKVDSNETLEFITALAGELDGVAKSESQAVWQAKLKLLNEKRHPRVWSAFDIYY